jgi:RHS repeat-associated protein
MYVTDYLGSVRAVVDGRTGELYKAVDYSSYGEETIVESASIAGGLTLRDGYTGKEDQHPDFGTSYTDFGARQYHPALHRWMTPDPLSEKYYGVSPYAFSNNDPVNFVDLDGEVPTPVVGAIIGGAISGTAAIIKGKSFTEVIAATAGGAVDGAIAASGFRIVGKLGKLAGKLVTGGLGAIGGGAGDIVEQGLNMLFGNQEEIEYKSAGVSAAMGIVSAGVGDTVEEGMKSMAKSAIGSQSTYEAVEKEVKAKIKSTGRNPKPGTVKSLVKADIQGMNDASEKTIHVSVEAVEGSIEFYNEIFDNDE